MRTAHSTTLPPYQPQGQMCFHTERSLMGRLSQGVEERSWKEAFSSLASLTSSCQLQIWGGKGARFQQLKWHMRTTLLCLWVEGGWRGDRERGDPRSRLPTFLPLFNPDLCTPSLFSLSCLVLLAQVLHGFFLGFHFLWIHLWVILLYSLPPLRPALPGCLPALLLASLSTRLCSNCPLQPLFLSHHYGQWIFLLFFCGQAEVKELCTPYSLPNIINV